MRNQSTSSATELSALTTASIVAMTAIRPLHTLPARSLRKAAVSSQSIWPERVWFLDRELGVPKHERIIDFRTVEFADGSSLCDEGATEMLDWCKRFIWSLIASPSNGLSKLKSITTCFRGLKTLVEWMYNNGVKLPVELTAAATERFVAYVAESYTDDEGQIKITARALLTHINPVWLLWEQRIDMESAGYHILEAQLFGGKTSFEVATELCSTPLGWWQPLPDEVAVPLLNRVAWFFETAAVDIINLSEELTKCSIKCSIGNLTLDQRHDRLRKVVENFVFSTDPATGQPWHSPLNDLPGNSLQKGVGRAISLIHELTGACIIILIAMTGMRISELSQLKAGMTRPLSPSCVRKDISSTGLNEIFTIASNLIKGEDSPREEDWIIGMRPVGSIEVPLPVRALLVLNSLFAGIRKFTGSEALFVPLLSGKAGFSTVSLDEQAQKYLSKDTLRSRIEQFIFRWVDFSQLPDDAAVKIQDGELVKYRESRGTCIHSHQFRKTYANFTLAVDPRLLPAVQMQFKHISIAMTESGYWGSNRAQVEPVNSVQQQQAVLTVFAAATGQSLLSGRMGTKISDNLEELKLRILGLSTHEAWKETVAYCSEIDLRLWFAPHGKCLPLLPSQMRCHLVAGTRPGQSRQPNFATREPSLCAGCANFVLDSRHRQFWIDRYVENSVAYGKAQALKLAGAWRLPGDRADQARALLKLMGVTDATLDNARAAAWLTAGKAAALAS